jgi:L-lactate dehydrogenase
MKIGIVGLGWVGSSVAISTLHSGIASELLLNDARPGLAEGEAMDLAHGDSFYSSARVGVAEVSEMRDCDAVVISAGRGGSPEESRLDLLRDNVRIVDEIATQLRGASGVLVVVTNPVDVMVRVATAASGLPPSRVIGTGTMLDTARLRQTLGLEFSVDPRSVHAQVVGEHGDSEVVLWSGARIGGARLSTWPEWNEARQKQVAERVRRAAYEIIRRKGATNHAIGLVTAALLRWMLRGAGRVVCVSRVQEGVLGLRDTALSLPTIVSPEGAVRVLEPDVTEEERQGILASARVLDEAWASVRDSAAGQPSGA